MGIEEVYATSQFGIRLSVEMERCKLATSP